MNSKVSKNVGGRPRMLADERRTNNKFTVYISDRDLRILELDRAGFYQFLKNQIIQSVKAKSEGE